MSYDLAIWHGSRPADDAAAAELYEKMHDRYLPEGGTDGDLEIDPTPAIVDFVAALVARWPDLDADGGDDSPWSDGPLINNAAGPYLYFGMVFSKAEEASAFAAELAKTHGLVCFDPQTGKLR